MLGKTPLLLRRVVRRLLVHREDEHVDQQRERLQLVAEPQGRQHVHLAARPDEPGRPRRDADVAVDTMSFPSGSVIAPPLVRSRG